MVAGAIPEQIVWLAPMVPPFTCWVNKYALSASKMPVVAAFPLNVTLSESV
jgi:hypothetical protein